MERQLWKQIVSVIREVIKGRAKRIYYYPTLTILKVWFWSVIHDRPVSWACNRINWRICDRRLELPSNSTMSRRMRSKEVIEILRVLEQRVFRGTEGDSIFWMIDGKPLPISGCSKDPHAGYGRSAGCKARGYKIHAIVGAGNTVAAWRLAPMNKDERVMAKRMIPNAGIAGYLMADGNYDSNKLHKQCDEDGNLQLVSPRRGGPGRGLGHRRQTTGRLRSKEILEDEMSNFGKQMMIDRVAIERYFASLTVWGGGLSCLPAWVRTYPRVHRWVQAKMLINALRNQTKQMTCAV